MLWVMCHVFWQSGKRSLANAIAGLKASIEGVNDVNVEVSALEFRCSRIPTLLWWKLMMRPRECLLLHHPCQSIQRPNA